MPPASGEDLGESGVVDADGEDDGHDYEESGDLAFAEFGADRVLSCHRPDPPGLKPLLSMRFNGKAEGEPLQEQEPRPKRLVLVQPFRGAKAPRFHRARPSCFHPIKPTASTARALPFQRDTYSSLGLTL